MASIALLPALALVCGAASGLWWDPVPEARGSLLLLLAAASVTWYVARLHPFTLPILLCGFFLAAAMVAADARDRTLHTPLRTLLARTVGSFAIDDPEPAVRHDPLAIRALLVEDGALQDDFAILRALVVAVRFGSEWQPTRGGVTFSVGGRPSLDQIVQWRAGRTIETFATFRRPSRYLNDGVPDFERQLALDGTTLFGSIKSGRLVEVTSVGSFMQETAGHVRLHVRRSIEQWVAPHSNLSAAILTAVLIGDRTALPDEVRLRLQAAGTYHVIAISGGNIAILAALVLGMLLVCGVTGHVAALVTIVVLVAYAQIVNGGASVWRATLMAVLYFGARMLDHRTPAWNAVAVAGAVALCARPLDVRDVGFMLTFGATVALLEAGRRTTAMPSRYRAVRWVIASLAASMAVEAALLPVSAWAFSRVTSAGLVLNLVAVPVMGLVQICGICVSLLSGIELIARPAGWIGHMAAVVLVDSARLVDAVPWLTMRVPPPPVALVLTYYAALGAALWMRGIPRFGCVVVAGAAAAGMVTGQPAGWLTAVPDSRSLRVTAFDVGQGDATLLEFPDRSTLLVDAGGVPFGGTAFDVGSRVLSPALWNRGLRRVDTLLLTHGDPDHIGGAPAIVDDFSPSEVWEGIPVVHHRALQALLGQARESNARVAAKLAGDVFTVGAARIRVLHPQAPGWERQRVRNDDSVVLEVRYGDVAIVLLGDVGAATERTILPQLTPARLRILKVAHHGSRTSTSPELLEGWQPQIAVISCGRGNTFGHPAPEVLRRLESIGAAIYRTDLDGQITIDTDGMNVRVRTYVGER
jgi:competence protein ComEC